jgi:hypothetical protein
LRVAIRERVVAFLEATLQLLFFDLVYELVVFAYDLTDNLDHLDHLDLTSTSSMVVVVLSAYCIV